MPTHMLPRVAAMAAVLVAAALLGAGLRAIVWKLWDEREESRRRFWVTQAVHLAVLIAVLAGALLIWKPQASNLGWLGAGVAIALQRAILSFAGYLILLRGKVFTVGDRITIGGVRGDVVSLGFMQTTIMEMGQTPAEQSDEPSMWIRGRQYSGRIVRVTNDRIFDLPVYNYTREFPYLWEELMIPVRYGDDRASVERFMLDAATQRTAEIVAEAKPLLDQVGTKFFIDEDPQLEPRVFLRMTDNWIELSVRYLARTRSNRVLADSIHRDVLTELEKAKIPVASSTMEISGVPEITVRTDR